MLPASPTSLVLVAAGLGHRTELAAEETANITPELMAKGSAVSSVGGGRTALKLRLAGHELVRRIRAVSFTRRRSTTSLTGVRGRAPPGLA